MADIFICYRRDDSAGWVRALYDRLRREFGDKRLFIDIDNIPAGTDFAARINRVIQEARVALIVIGKDWIPADSWTRSRLDNPDDYVRLEVAAALRRRKNFTMIPVLVHGASMPPASRLPQELRKLTERNAHHLRDISWDADVEILIGRIRSLVGTGKTAQQKPRQPRGKTPAGTPEAPRKRAAAPQPKPAAAPPAKQPKSTSRTAAGGAAAKAGASKGSAPASTRPAGPRKTAGGTSAAKGTGASTRSGPKKTGGSQSPAGGKGGGQPGAQKPAARKGGGAADTRPSAPRPSGGGKKSPAKSTGQGAKSGSRPQASARKATAKRKRG